MSGEDLLVHMQNLSFSFLLFLRSTYLTGRQSWQGGGRERDLHLAGLLSKWAQWPGLDKNEVMSLDLLLALPRG